MPALQIVIYILYAMLVIFTTVVIIFNRREPSKALAWMLVVVLVPVVGIMLYVLFGRNHRKEKIFNHKEIRDLEHINALSRRQLDWIRNEENLNQIDNVDIMGNLDIIKLLLNSNKALVTTHNRLTVLNNGKEKFDALLEALEGARESIHLEYYIYEDDQIGRRIGEILKRKVSEGVEVRLIYDDVGSWSLSRKFIRELRMAGVEVRCFMPVVFPWLTSKVNYRNHRKIAVIDGRIGFTGGLNIADRYMVTKGKKRWRDTHLKVEGDAAASLQSIFVTDWFFLNDQQTLNDEKYFPAHDITDFVPVQIASSGPDSDWATIMQAYFSAMSRAAKHIYISTPYFLPNNAIMTAIKVAALSGVDVRLLIPSKADHKIVFWATCSYISDLLNAGVKVYQYTRGFNHSKTIMIDGKLCAVGTANMDIRSFEVNFEVSAFIYDRKLTAQLEETFLRDLRQSRQINPRQWESRPKTQKFIEFLSSLFSPLF